MRRRKKTSKMWMAMMLTVMVTVWMAGTGVVRAATGTFVVGGEIVSATLTGDANSVTGTTSYTKGPGEVRVQVNGKARIPGTSREMSITTEPAIASTPGGASRTMLPPAGYVLISANSDHYATINGDSKPFDLTLF